MSTQRRESRSSPARMTDRRDARIPARRTPCTRLVGAQELFGSAPTTVQGPVHVSGGTAPPVIPARFRPSDEDPSPGAPELATNSLQSDYRRIEFVQPVCIMRGLPPPAALRRQDAAVPAINGSSLPPIPFPSGLARLHPTLPQFPAGKHRRAERYDGKRDLHFQHAA